MSGSGYKFTATRCCSFCGAASSAANILVCEACRSVAYCGPACQRAHWKPHNLKIACKAEAQRRFEGLLVAAQAGDRSAQFYVGCSYMYASGNGVRKDPSQAFAWYLRAAEAGEPEASAACNLGVCYGNGTGVAADPAQANIWFRKSAEAGYPPGQLNLAKAYCRGVSA